MVNQKAREISTQAAQATGVRALTWLVELGLDVCAAVGHMYVRWPEYEFSSDYEQDGWGDEHTSYVGH